MDTLTEILTETPLSPADNQFKDGEPQLETCELFRLIPKDKLDYLFAHSDASAELDAGFLGFEEIYKDVLQYVPKEKIIIDLGCAYATQSWYFREHSKYIGVDYSMNEDSVIHTENSEFYFTTIQDFIQDVLPSLSLDLKDVFAVCSYVPDNEARLLAEETFQYCRIYYPGLISILKPPEAFPTKVYRFELAFAGDPQGVGLFQGLDDTPIPPGLRDKLYHLFDDLPVPPGLDALDGGHVSFWFTEKGLTTFADSINSVIAELEEYDWQVLGTSFLLDADTSNTLSIRDALYVDDYQMAFNKTDILELSFFTDCEYKEISCVRTECKDPLQFKEMAASCDTLVQKAKPSLTSQILSAENQLEKQACFSNGVPKDRNEFQTSR